MKTNIFKIAAILLFVAGSFASCEKNNISALQGSKWKLAGIVDAETGILTELEPTDCEECYTLTFDTDSTFSTYSSFEHSGLYKVDYTTYDIDIIAFGSPELPEKSKDGKLYCDVFVSVQSFSLQRNELRLYYNDNKNYLLFKPQ